MLKSYYGIIDIGSNTMRLVIYSQEKSGRLHEVENVKAVARLRNFLNHDNLLNEEGIGKLLTTLKSFKNVVDTYELTAFACIATATIRQSHNKELIREIIQQEIGWDIRVLSEREEAFYGYLSVVNSTSITEGVTIDIGGGSTEITYFKDRILKHYHSFPFGALTLKEFFADNQSKETALTELQYFLQDQFSTLDWIQDMNVPLIGIGGSARNLAQIDQTLQSYPLAGLHQYQMTDRDIAHIVALLASLEKVELEKVEGLSKDRADTILPASCVFLTLYKAIEANGFILSRKGLRDGVFYEYLSENTKSNLYPNVLEDSIVELIYEYNLDIDKIHHIQYLTAKLFRGLQDNGIADLTQDDWVLLERACFVYNLGAYIDSESSPQHTFYLIANRTIDGLMHADRLKTALIASYKNKTLFKQFIAPFKHWFLKKERNKLNLLGTLLKFTYSLDTTNRQVIEDFDMDINEESLTLKLYCSKDYKPEQYQAEKQKKHFEKALGKSIELHFL
ncbi:Ppx/GppA family phosphatase [Oceanobacillus massiliensis]|uniref:Ppx/GppA family phosphatase n=1 Tax=Oceanobacillus massiliensis TaxID=1465765 RepID=UPI00028917F8|nr:Ppx/GppA family phosphatase [Oceanobacillus massiliensis]